MFLDPLGRQPGEALDPTRHTVDDLKIRELGNPRLFAAVWQQSPRAAGGNLINIVDFKIIDKSEVPINNMVWGRAYDLAFSEKEVAKAKPDFTATCRMGLHREGDSYDFYIYNIDRWQQSWSKSRRRMRELGFVDGTDTKIIVEGGGPQKGLGDSLKDDVLFAPFSIFSFPPIADKVARAQPWIDKLEIGKIYLVREPSNKVFLDECEAFNQGAHDDMVDAVSLVFYYLMQFLKQASVTAVPVRGLYGRRK
jgi:predicted phage terminase large subunit-like protein